MKHELELRLQAWVDGETSGREAARIAEWVGHDSEAGALAAHLRAVKNGMAGNESALALPETRQFYWSKIERQIHRESLDSRRTPISWLARWRRLLIPACGAAALACVLSLAVNQIHQPAFDEISATDPGMEAVTFHDQSAQMTVVWLQDNSQAAAAAKPANPSAPDDANSDVEME